MLVIAVVPLHAVSAFVSEKLIHSPRPNQTWSDLVCIIQREPGEPGEYDVHDFLGWRADSLPNIKKLTPIAGDIICPCKKLGSNWPKFVEKTILRVS